MFSFLDIYFSTYKNVLSQPSLGLLVKIKIRPSIMPRHQNDFLDAVHVFLEAVVIYDIRKV